MADYEKLREIRIAGNKLKMKELGVRSMAYEISQSKKGSKVKNNCKMQSKKIVEDTSEHTTGEEESQSSEENNNDTRIVNLRSHSKKVMAVNEKSHAKMKQKTNVSTLSMAAQVKMRHQNTKIQAAEQRLQRSVSTQSRQNLDLSASVNSEVGLNKSTTSKQPFKSHQEKEAERAVQTKIGQSKVMVAPGSLRAYLKMKAMSKENEARETQNDVFLQQQPTTQPNVLQALDHVKTNSHMRSFSQTNPFQPSLEGNYHLDMSVDEAESDMNDMDDDAEDGNDDTQVSGGPTSALSKVKRTRGPTMCKDVYEWTLEDRKLIILNEMGKPIGPDRKTLDKFSRFLGTLARNSTLAPPNKVNWHKVAEKDKIWDFVKTKFIIAEEGKAHVLSTVGRLWRRHKCIVKKNHFKAYDNDDQRKENAPDTIPENYFEDLLEFWQVDVVEEQSKKNTKSSINQKDRHTMGPMSFARKEYELQQQDEEKKKPSQAQLYKDSRKRKVGKNYKTSYEPIKNNIDKMEEVQMQRQIDGDRAYYEVMVPDNGKNQRQLGKSSTIKGKSKGNSVGGVIIPDEFLKPYKDQIVKETVGEVMKMFKQQLPPETFSNLTRSLGDVTCNPEISEFPSEDTNDQEHDKDEDNGLE